MNTYNNRAEKSTQRHIAARHQGGRKRPPIDHDDPSDLAGLPLRHHNGRRWRAYVGRQ